MQTSFICPNTDTALEFELPSEEQAMATLWPHPLSIQCPACDKNHEVAFREAYVTGVMAKFACVPADVREARVH